MADGLSIAASVSGLITLADVIVRKGYKYIKAVKDAEKSLKALVGEVNKLSGILHSLKNVVERLECDKFELKPTTQIHYVEACYQTLLKIQKHLEEADPAATKSSYDANKLKLRWPMASSRIKEFLAEVETHITAMTLAMNADEMSALLVLLARQDGIDSSLKSIEESLESDRAQRKEIEINELQKDMLSFLSSQDAQTRLDSNVRLKQPGTGVWFISGLYFRNWLIEERSRLWVHGIPGAGKTVLISVAILEAQKRTNESNALAYFFCDYKDSTTHDPIEILGALAKQIATQHEDCLMSLETFYRSHKTKERSMRQPATEELCNFIQEMSRNFKSVMIIVDGLDEISKHRSDVTEILQSLNTPTGTIKTLFSSRREFDLEHPLRDYVQLSIAAMSSDLRLYVAAEIAKRTESRKLRIQDPDLKEYIMKTLIDGAEGMFRWVACQIDYLCECNNDRDRREALKQFPPDLPSSYERILARVNKSSKKNQRLVIRTLTWLLYAKKQLTSDELLLALAVEDGESDFDRSAMSTEDDLFHWCSSLIRRKTWSRSSPSIEFAHFTVKEYLLTLGDISNSEISKYYLSKHDADIMLGRTCITFLNYNTFGTFNPPDSDYDLRDVLDPIFTNYRFIGYAAWFWNVHAVPHIDDEIVSLLVGKLLAPVPGSQFRLWRSLIAFDYESWWSAYYDDDRLPIYGAHDTDPLHWAACFGLEDLCKRLLKHGADVNSASLLGHPLCCAILGEEIKLRSIVHLEGLLEEISAADSARESTVKLLLSAGADLEKKECFYEDDSLQTEIEFSPLSLAIRAELGNEPKIFKALISHGATLLADGVEYVISKKLDFEVTDFVEALYACATEGTLRRDTRESIFKLALNDGLDNPSRCSRLKALEICGVIFEETYKYVLQVLEYSVKDESLEALKIISKVLLRCNPGANAPGDFLRNLVLPFMEYQGIGELEDLLEEDLLLSCVDKDDNTLLHLILLEAHLENFVVSRFNNNKRDTNHHDMEDGDKYESDELESSLGSDGDELSSSLGKDGIEDYSDKETQMLSLVKILLKRGENIATRNNRGETALHLAAQQKSFELFRLVYDAADSSTLLRSPTKEGRTPLWYAINSESELIVEFLINKLDQVELNLDQDDALPQHDLIPIMVAAKNCRWKVVRRLLDPAEDETILLSQAVQIFLYAAEDGATEILEHLVDEFPDLDIETRDEIGATPLLLAAQRSQNLLAVEFLLERGAKLTARCDSGTVAHFAVSADDNAIRERLLYLGIKWNTEGKCLAKSSGPYDGSPLHKAAAEGRVSAIKFLLKNKLIDPNLKSTTGVTPLSIAIQWNQRDAVQALLDYGSSIDNQDAHGRTHLHLAAGLGYKEIVETLLERGGDASIRDSAGLTPKDRASKKGHPEIEDLIQFAMNKEASNALLNTLLDMQHRPKDLFTFCSQLQLTNEASDSVISTSFPVRTSLSTSKPRKSVSEIEGLSPKPLESTIEAIEGSIPKPTSLTPHRPTIFRMLALSPERAEKCYSRLAKGTPATKKKLKRKEGDTPAFLVWKPEETLRDTGDVHETPILMLYKDLEPVLGGVVRAVVLE